MNLYPLKFKYILKPVIWGGSEICKFKHIQQCQDGIGESWEISGVDGNISVVAEGELAGKNLQELIDEYRNELVGKNIYEIFGNKFPLLIKFIDAKDDLSIQVHPDDKLAKERHNSFGKTEMWYVIEAKENAFLYSGFKKHLDTKLYIKSVGNNTFTEYLAKHTVKKGDAFFLPAGRVHAIGAGTFIAEIQQTSDITYRIYDYNRKDKDGNLRELHTELAKDAIDYTVYDNYRIEYQEEKNKSVNLETCSYFTTNLLSVDKCLVWDYSKLDSFVIYICVGGKSTIYDNKGNELKIQQGETVLIPADTEWVMTSPEEEVLLLEVYIK